MRYPIDEIATGDCTTHRAKLLIRDHLEQNPDGWAKVYSVLRAFTWKMLAERRTGPMLKPWCKLILKLAQDCPDTKIRYQIVVMADMFEMSETAARTGTPTVTRRRPEGAKPERAQPQASE